MRVDAGRRHGLQQSVGAQLMQADLHLNPLLDDAAKDGGKAEQQAHPLRERAAGAKALGLVRERPSRHTPHDHEGSAEDIRIKLACQHFRRGIAHPGERILGDTVSSLTRCGSAPGRLSRRINGPCHGGGTASSVKPKIVVSKPP